MRQYHETEKKEIQKLAKMYREFLDAGLKVTVNTDNRTVSNTTLTKELEFVQKTYGIRDDEIYLLMKNAADVAFTDDAVREKLYRKLEGK